MAFTVRDFQGLVRALERRAEWKAELRRLLLTEELLSLPQVVGGLVQAVRELGAGHAQLVEEVRGLAAGHARLSEELAQLSGQVRELAAGQGRLTEEVRGLAAGQGRLTEEVRGLAAGQARLSEELAQLSGQVRELTTAQSLLTADVRALVGAQRHTEDRLGRLEGSELERRYRERAASFFQRILTRIRVVDHQELGLLLDDAVETGSLTSEEKAEILLADVVIRGRRDQRDAYALAEVSVLIGAEDVRRARARARLLERALGVPVLAVVAGRQLGEEAARDARAVGVWTLLDGRAEEPTSPGG